MIVVRFFPLAATQFARARACSCGDLVGGRVGREMAAIDNVNLR
jgi:hypothetical protein